MKSTMAKPRTINGLRVYWSVSDSDAHDTLWSVYRSDKKSDGGWQITGFVRGSVARGYEAYLPTKWRSSKADVVEGVSTFLGAVKVLVQLYQSKLFAGEITAEGLRDWQDIAQSRTPFGQ